MVWSKHYARQNVIGKKEMQRRFPGIFPVLGAVRSTIYLCHHCNKPFPVPVTGVAVGRQVNRCWRKLHVACFLGEDPVRACPAHDVCAALDAPHVCTP